MNSHLNVFKIYTKSNRAFQLENDLTRAFAICMQEDNLFFHEILKFVFNNSNHFLEFFDDIASINNINISIQRDASSITSFDKIYAISLSESILDENIYWNQSHEKIYDPICDIVIQINNVTIIIETKRDGVDCTSQLYNQVFNICQKNDVSKEEMVNVVCPLDLHWPKLMAIAIKVYSFENSTGTPNRFLSDFISLVKGHNFRWLPETAIISLAADNTKSIKRRMESVVNELDKSEHYNKLNYIDRLGFLLNKPWAKEILFDISKDGSLIISVYPGNTKAQGETIFYQDPKFAEQLIIENIPYKLNKAYYVKFSGQGYFTGLWFTDKDLKKDLYTRDNFRKYAGRRKRDIHWNSISDLFDECFTESYNWKAKCSWGSKIMESKRTQFDLSFGYELTITVPFTELKRIDTNKSDLSGLIFLIESAYQQFNNVIN
jgi:hypothetical protein